MVKVSIIVPVYNMERYLGTCLDALCAQTLDDIEIVAVDDGSTDGSAAVLADYAARDERIRVVSKRNSGYGASMNRGIAEARGAYVGVVEPDDYPDLVMFEKLYATAVKYGCDVVKCNYYQHFDDHEDIHWNLHGLVYGAPFDPVDMPRACCTAPSIWAGLYRRAFLVQEGIDFRETPGAAFQDAAFSLKVWYAARCAVLLRRPMLHYRMDNLSSSSKASDKVFEVCDELASAASFLRARPARADAFLPWHHVGAWEKYRWNYARIDAASHRGFAARMRTEFQEADEAGELDLDLFDATSRSQLELLLACGEDAFVRAYPTRYPAHWEVGADGAGTAGEAGAADAARLGNGDREAGGWCAPAALAAPDGPSPAVTVVVPVYNCEPYVRACIDSLKRQTYSDFEAIVVDDASTDGSLAAVREAIGDDGRFALLPQPANRGLSAVRNIALERARGEYIVFLDSDDFLVDDALAKLVARARSQRLDDLYFSARSFYESASLSATMREDFSRRPSFEGVTSGRELFVFFEEHDQFFAQAALRMIRRQFLEDEGIRFVEGILHEDILFTFQTLAASRRSSFLNEPLYLRRLREGSIIGSRWTVRHIHGHFYSMQQIKTWLYENAGDLDDAFLRAIGHRMGIWREVCAHRWEHDLGEEERTAYLAGLAARDRVDFHDDVLGSGGAADRVRDEYLASLTYRLGDALLSAPRVMRDRIGAIAGARKAGFAARAHSGKGPQAPEGEGA